MLIANFFNFFIILQIILDILNNMEKCIFIISFLIIFINNLISQNIDKIHLENGKYILRLSDSIYPYNNFTNLSNQNILTFKNENRLSL